jgi:hypothetical protein
MKNKISVAVTALLALAVATAIFFTVGGQTPPAAQAQSETAPRTITVIGEGLASAAPDTAIVNIGVEVGDPEVKTASDQAAAQMQAVMTALAGEGVAPKDIQTSYYSLYVDRPYTPDGQPGQPTYRVSNTMQVTIRQLDQVTQILSAAIEAGANTINSVDFQLSKTVDLRSEARARAVTDAETRAAELAKLTGVAVGEVVSVSEVINNGYYAGNQFNNVAKGMGGGAAGPISPGEVDVNVQLQIVYAILR